MPFALTGYMGKSFALFGLFLSTGVFAQSQVLDFAYSKVRNVYTISSDLKVQGPVLRPGQENQYVTEIFRELVRGVHRSIERDFSPSRPAYWAFLLGALAIPYHESRLIHFREARHQRECNDDIQRGRAQAKDSVLVQKLEQHLLNDKDTVLEPCSQINIGKDKNKQLIASSNYRSLGLFQINMLWHPVFMRERDYLSVVKTIDYGISLYKNGFLGSLFDKPSCVHSFASNREEWSKRLVRASWAGWFNSGKQENACRFEKMKAEDVKFEADLNELLNTNENSFSEHLSGDELAAFEEIRSNIKNGRFDTKYLSRILR